MNTQGAVLTSNGNPKKKTGTDKITANSVAFRHQHCPHSKKNKIYKKYRI